MRKFLMAIAAATLMSFGIVGVSSAPASAIECPYEGCVSTKTTINAPDSIKRRTRPTLSVRTAPRSGNATVRGTHTVTCETRDGRSKSIVRRYVGNGFEQYEGPRLGKGRWVCTASFRSEYKFKASSDSTVIRAR